MSYIYCDTETTGVSNKDALVEISLIDEKGNNLFSTLVNPKMPIPFYATRVHGIKDKDVKNAPTWSEIEDKICELVKGHTLVAHNMGFDKRFLGRVTQAAKNLECSLQLAKKTIKRKSYKLEDLAKESGFKHKGDFHRAIKDTLACRHVHQWLLSKNKTSKHDDRLKKPKELDCPLPTMSGKPWTQELDKRLIELWDNQTDMNLILKEMLRSYKAICLRLQHLNKIDKKDHAY